MNALQRIYSHIEINYETTCWLWLGAKKAQNSYGHLQVGSRSDSTRKTVAAHRYSYEVFNGSIPKGMWVLHLCDNPTCVNPVHLFLGNRQDNVDDREHKGRNHHVVGEKIGISKLTEIEVAMIRCCQGEKSSRCVAKEYGIHHTTILDIWNRKSWSHIPEPPEDSDVS